MLGVHDGRQVPTGGGEMVLVPHAHQILVHVAHGGVIVPGQGLALLPVTVAILAGPVLQVPSVTLKNEWAHQVEATFAFTGVSEASGVELFSLAGVLD